MPCWPSTKSLPSPPSRMSIPLLPSSVSLPAPPSTVMAISAARFPVALKRSSPPLALSTSFSDVPMSIANGAGSRRSKRTRVPLAVVVNCSAPLPPLTSTVSRAGAALVEVGVVARVPDHPVVAALPEGLVVGVAAGDRVVVARRRTAGRSRPCPAGCRCRPGRRAGRRPSRPSACRCRRRRTGWPPGSAPLVSLSVTTSLPPWPNTWISAVLATVGVPPVTATAPPFTRIFPAASRLTVIVLSSASPNTVSCPG